MLVDDGLVDDLPEVLCGLKFGGVGWEKEQSDAVGNREVALGVPAGIVEHENDDAVSAGPGLLGEGGQQGLEERFRDAAGDVPEAFSGGWRHERGDVKPSETMMAERDWTGADRRPYASHDRLQSEPMLVGRERFDRDAGMGRGFFGDDFGDFFLKASCSAALAAFGLRGRGFWIDQPTAFSASQPRCGASFSSPRSPAIQRATLPLVQTPPSGGGSFKRTRSRRSNSGFRTAPR